MNLTIARKTAGLKLKGLKHEALCETDKAIECYKQVVEILKNPKHALTNQAVELLGFQNRVFCLQVQLLLKKYKRIDECSPQKPWCKNPTYSNVAHYHCHYEDKLKIMRELYKLFRVE